MLPKKEAILVSSISRSCWNYHIRSNIGSRRPACDVHAQNNRPSMYQQVWLPHIGGPGLSTTASSIGHTSSTSLKTSTRLTSFTLLGTWLCCAAELAQSLHQLQQKAGCVWLRPPLPMAHGRHAPPHLMHGCS
mmetsp:Transcript_63345/g.128605  ORF Transcript_63345/g.128605 Transcript_63345/m.128605 type:complete len:133 (-) Transcript_63345:111-509(-)